MEAQVDELRQALIDVAKREELELVAGRDKKVVVKQVEKVMFLRKGEESDKAAELEEALRETKWWKTLIGLAGGVSGPAFETRLSAATLASPATANINRRFMSLKSFSL